MVWTVEVFEDTPPMNHTEARKLAERVSKFEGSIGGNEAVTLADALILALDNNAALAEKLKARDARIEALEKAAHTLRGMVK